MPGIGGYASFLACICCILWMLAKDESSGEA